VHHYTHYPHKSLRFATADFLHSTQVTGEELQARNQALVKSIKEHLGSEGFAEFRTLSAQFQQVKKILGF
jgi:hypothetical protein